MYSQEKKNTFDDSFFFFFEYFVVGLYSPAPFSEKLAFLSLSVSWYPFLLLGELVSVLLFGTLKDGGKERAI